MPPTLTDLITLARQAGEILRSSFGQHLHVDHKGVIDLVSDADRRSEAVPAQPHPPAFPWMTTSWLRRAASCQALLTTPGTSTRWMARSITSMVCPSTRFRLLMLKRGELRTGCGLRPDAR